MTCSAPGPADHPLQALQAFRGPLRCQQDLLEHRAGCTGITLPYTHPGTIPHPYTRPGTHPLYTSDTRVLTARTRSLRTL